VGTALTYIKYPKTGATGCTTLTACLEIEVLDTTAPRTVDFYIRVVLGLGQDPVAIPAKILITPCRLNTITVPVHPSDVVYDKSPIASNSLALSLHSSYTNLYVLSNPALCPLLNLELCDNSNVLLASPYVQMANGLILTSSQLIIRNDATYTMDVKLKGYMEG